MKCVIVAYQHHWSCEFMSHLSEVGAVRTAPKVVNYSLRRGEKVPSMRVHACSHRNFFSKKGVPQPWIIGHLFVKIQGTGRGHNPGTFRQPSPDRTSGILELYECHVF